MWECSRGVTRKKYPVRQDITIEQFYFVNRNVKRKKLRKILKLTSYKNNAIGGSIENGL